jgi:hypothetical protein
MADPREDLRSTEESIVHDAEQVKSLEAEKADLDPADPRVPELSERIAMVTDVLAVKASAEEELSDQIQGTT